LILVAFLVPVAIYLLALGWVNRQARPIVVSGTWDLIGLIFAASGFLLVGGPAALAFLNERWRMFWVLGEGNPIGDNLDGVRQLWVLAAIIYFALVLGICVAMFRRRRHHTCIYNVEPASVETALVQTCDQLGLAPIRSGNLFVFGLEVNAPTQRPVHRPEGIQAPHTLPVHIRSGPSLEDADSPNNVETLSSASDVGELLLGHNAVLEFEPFAAMKHVTLRWEPADSPIRPHVEAELSQRLTQIGSPEHETGVWLNLVGSGLLLCALLVVVILTVRALLVR